MKAILINAKDRTIELVENNGDLSSMYDAIGCDMVEIGHFDTSNGDTLWVDEEGLLKDPQFGFVLYDKQFAGNGIIYGSNIGGDNISVRSTIDSIIEHLLFFRVEAEASI